MVGLHVVNQVAHVMDLPQLACGHTHAHMVVCYNLQSMSVACKGHKQHQELLQPHCHTSKVQFASL